MIEASVNIGACIAKLCPGAEFTIHCTAEGERSIHWKDKNTKCPSDDEINRIWQVIQKEHAVKVEATHAAAQRLEEAAKYISSIEVDSIAKYDSTEVLKNVVLFLRRGF